MPFTRQIIIQNCRKTPNYFLKRTLPFRRLLSSSQKDHLANWLSKHEFPVKQPPLSDQLNVRRIEGLYSTLATLDGRISLPAHRYGHTEIRKGNELSPGHSLIFCNPVAPERDLESDATISVSPAPEPFVRRMWAGGSFRFLRPLYLGDEVAGERSVKNIEIKKLDSENPMVVVEQEIVTNRTSSFDGSNSTAEKASPCIIETRSHVYVPITNKQRTRKEFSYLTAEEMPESDFAFSYVPTDTTLFRFSALTFNAHRIHLDKEYAQNVEGLQERLVHGPLTALLLLEVVENNRPSNLRIERFEYRATNPLFINSPVTIAGKWISDTEVRVWARSDDNIVGMKGQVWLK